MFCHISVLILLHYGGYKWMFVDNLKYLFSFCGSPVCQTGYIDLTERKITSASLSSRIAPRAGCQSSWWRKWVFHPPPLPKSES